MRCEAGVCRNRATIECCGVWRCPRCQRGHETLAHPERNARLIVPATRFEQAEELREAMSRAESPDELRRLMNASCVMTWQSTAERPCCAHVNPRWLEYTGSRLTRELDSGWMRHIHPADRERYHNSDPKPARWHYRVRRADGSWVWAIDDSVVLIENGRPIGYAGTVIAINELAVP